MIEIGRLRTEVALQRTMSGVERERGVEIVREAARQMVGCASMSDRKFRAHFFGTVEMTWDVWETIRFHQRLGAEVGLLDFLRFLYFIKVHGPSLDVIATRLHIDQVRLKRQCRIVARLIWRGLPEVCEGEKHDNQRDIYSRR